MCVCVCLSEGERNLPLMKTERVYYKVILLENTSNVIKCQYFICPVSLIASFGIFRSKAAHRRDYGFCYESSAVAMRNPLVQRGFCVIRIGTLNGVTVRSVFINSEEISVT